MIRKDILPKLYADESGASAVEYALILGLVVLVVIVSIDSVATVTLDMWTDIADKTATAVSGT
ncbi:MULTISPECIES: Flp family type IVb pilin [Novosphingobium]|uniref:Pilus assembly protein Flp/PilA n=1 Tax=Novosphingobium mathurense TaxID=428990 RepID=A0A1U6H372_9SPHN|nr:MULTISPECIES: Flp family type IVb pilin [Novosphingobium]CDO34236.1 conserved hypothetical protein [Novosphingobium sp. KN65.2]SLJ90264.1 pilus assembly protein Flp/PilA [Novosphingobium mathurense]